MELHEYRGESVAIELMQDGDIIAYRFYGAGVAEQVGTSYLPEAELLDVLLAPAGLTVRAGTIVARWGGARPGAGRPPLVDGETTVRSTITLPASLDAKALRLGDGNRSEGIRSALHAYPEDATDTEA